MYTFPYWHTFSVLVNFVIRGPDVMCMQLLHKKLAKLAMYLMWFTPM